MSLTSPWEFRKGDKYQINAIKCNLADGTQKEEKWVPYVESGGESFLQERIPPVLKDE